MALIGGTAGMLARMKSAQGALVDNSSGQNKSLTLPGGVRYLKMGEQTYLFDIIPFTVDRDDHPLKIPRGEAWWYTKFFAHRGIGPQEVTVACPQKNLGMPCPICEEVSRLRRDKDADHEAAIIALGARSRFLMYTLLDDKITEGIFIVEQSVKKFGGPLVDAVLSNLEEIADECPDMFDPKNGRAVKTVMKMESMGKVKYPAPSSFALTKKRGVLSQAQLVAIAKLPSLDSLVKHLNYDELQRLLEGAGPAPVVDDDDAVADPPETEHDDVSIHEPAPEQARETPSAVTQPPANPAGIDLSPSTATTTESAAETDPWA